MLKITNCVLKLVYFIDAKGNCDLCSNLLYIQKLQIVDIIILSQIVLLGLSTGL